MIDRAKLTQHILVAMVAGLLLGSIIHAANLTPDNPLLVYGINGVIDIGGQALLLASNYWLFRWYFFLWLVAPVIYLTGPVLVV